MTTLRNRAASRPISLALPILAVAPLATGEVHTNARPHQEDGLDERLEAVVRAELLDEGAAQVALHVETRGEVLFERAFGAGNAAGAALSTRSAVPADGWLEALSGAVLLRALDEGLLPLDDSVAGAFDGLGWDGAPTLAQLASHATGIPRLDVLEALPSTTEAAAERGEDESGAADSGEEAAPARPADPFLALVSRAELESEPGDCFEFRAANVVLAAKLAERWGGVLFEDDPLGIAALGLEDAGLFPGGEDERWTQWIQPGRSGSEAVHLGAHGLPALEASAADGAALVRALVAGGWTRSAGSQALLDPAPYANGNPVGYAFGLWRSSLADSAAHGATHRTGDWTIHAVHYDAFDLTVSLVVQGEVSGPAEVAARLARVCLDLPGPELEDRPLQPDELERFAGTYQVGCTTYEIVVGSTHLHLVGESFEESKLLYQGGGGFALAATPGIRLAFELQDARVTGFVLDDHGAQSRAVRLDR